MEQVWAKNVFYIPPQLVSEKFSRPDKHLSSYSRDARAETRVGLHVKCPLLLPDFNQNWNVPTNLSRTRLYEISTKSDQEVLEFLHACRQTDRRTDGSADFNSRPGWVGS
jgi:hypothetical protein